MSTEKITEVLARLEIKIDTIIEENKIVKQKIKEFSENPVYNSKTIEGISKPTPQFVMNNEYNECFQRHIGEFPHLNHTFHPQLNNITDIIQAITNRIEECCCKEKKEKTEEYNLVIPLEQYDKAIKEKDEEIKRLEEHRCITIKDLEKYFGKQKESIRIEPPLRFR